MSAPALSTRLADAALAALALLEAKEAGNLAGVAAIVDTTPPEDIVHGLMLIAGAARHGHAAATGVSVADVDELLRGMYLAVGAA